MHTELAARAAEVGRLRRAVDEAVEQLARADVDPAVVREHMLRVRNR